MNINSPRIIRILIYCTALLSHSQRLNMSSADGAADPDAEIVSFFNDSSRVSPEKPRPAAPAATGVASSSSSSFSSSPARSPAKKRKLNATGASSASASLSPSSSSSSSSTSSSSSAAAAAAVPAGVLGQFNLRGKIAVVTGGYGTLGMHMVHGLISAGAIVGVLGRSRSKCAAAVAKLSSGAAGGGGAFVLVADVTDRASLQAAADTVRARHGRLDILVNGAGGNSGGATVMPDQSFFDMDLSAFSSNLNLNLMGTVLPTQVFGRLLVAAGAGSIVNISSMAAAKPLTRVVSYSAAKAAVDSFTRWMATEMAQKVSPQVRVNAIAPGFFIADQNRKLLTNEDGSLTTRGNTIISATPTKRFGRPEELAGPLVWLCSDAASFVTGVVVPIDGGFSGWCAV